MTAEMAEVAQILKTPLELYKYVLNNVNTEFYYGSRKGAIGTYEQNGAMIMTNQVYSLQCFVT